MQSGKGKELGCETGLEVQAMVSQAGVWVPGRNVGLLESLELERFGQVLGRGPVFSPNQSKTKLVPYHKHGASSCCSSPSSASQRPKFNPGKRVELVGIKSRGWV